MTSDSLRDLIRNYRESYAVWHELLDYEREVRQRLIEEYGGPEGEEPDNLRELLREEIESSGQRDLQRKALARLKEDERLLFNYFLDHADTEQMKNELFYLSRDYAERITWLERFLDEDA